MRADRFGSRPRRVGLSLRVTLPEALAGTAAALLRGEGGCPVAEGAAAPEGGGPARRRLAITLDPGEAGDRALERLVTLLEALEGSRPGDEFELECEERLVEEDWGAVNARGFAPFAAAPGLVLRPPGRSYAPREGERVLAIDPGAAFGSGVHASTRLALDLVCGRCAAGAPGRVLDVGTGSGVLALAAALWGAGRVLGVDTDPDAVAAARANAAANGLASRVEIRAGGVAVAAGRFDLIAANVTAEVLLSLSASLVARLAPRGALVLSGILAGGQDDEVEAAFTHAGLRPAQRREEGEWVAILMERRRGGSSGGGTAPARRPARPGGGRRYSP